MPRFTRPGRARRIASGAVTLTLGAGGAAALVVAAMASASSFTLKVAKNVRVTNDPTKAFRVKPVNVTESIAVGPSGFAVYTFQGETTHHLICHKTTGAATNCWAFWPPVSPASGKSLSKPSGIKGKLGTFRHQGTVQLTLNGQPLYYFTPDLQSRNKRQATGDELKTFGSIWHIVIADPSGASRGPTSPEPTTPTTPTTTTSTSTTPTTTPTTTGPYPSPY